MMLKNLVFKFKRTNLKALLGVLTLGVILFGFQNCVEPGFYSITERSLEACIDPSCEDYKNNKAYCEFNGAYIGNNKSLKAYLTSNGECRSEMRTCQNGTLTGSYPYAFCSPGETAPGSCLFGNRTIANGESVTAYLNGSGDCDYERRTCNNGVLSGSYLYASCNGGSGSSHCLFNGRTIQHGSVVKAFQNSSVTGSQTCKEELRLCTNGVLSGSYQHNYCAVNVPRTCLFNNTVVPHQGSVTTYQSSTVPYGQTCKSQKRVCNDGALTGNYLFTSCNVGAPAHCLLNKMSVIHGQTVETFELATVPYGEECKKQTRKCTNGTLSGSYTFTECNVGAPASCRLDGKVYSHGSKMKAFSAQKEDGSCNELIRECHNGKLSGDESFKYVQCGNSGSGGSDGGDGSGGGSNNYACANNQIYVGNKCINEFSTCTAADRTLWKNLSKNGDERAKVAAFYCEFIGSYRTRQDFDKYAIYRGTPQNFCIMMLQNFALWDKCTNKSGDYRNPICYDNAEKMVKNIFQMALRRQPRHLEDYNDGDNFYYWTELRQEINNWNRYGSDNTTKAFIYLQRHMCDRQEFKNLHKDYL